jgi:hypothetical protein
MSAPTRAREIQRKIRVQDAHTTTTTQDVLNEELDGAHDIELHLTLLLESG